MEIENYELDKTGKITVKTLVKLLATGRQVWHNITTVEKRVKYMTALSMWRLDVIPSIKKDYKKETYVLGIDKGKAKNFDFFSKDLIIDERHEFHTVDEIVDYLDIMAYLKKERWIAQEEDILTFKPPTVQRIHVRKRRLEELEQMLLRGQKIAISYKAQQCKVSMLFWRQDVIHCVKKTNLWVAYALTIRVHVAKKVLLEEKFCFNNLGNLILFLDKNGYLKRNEWIKE